MKIYIFMNRYILHVQKHTLHSIFFFSVEISSIRLLHTWLVSQYWYLSLLGQKNQLCLHALKVLEIRCPEGYKYMHRNQAVIDLWQGTLSQVS
jgi:hypothetical protein